MNKSLAASLLLIPIAFTFTACSKSGDSNANNNTPGNSCKIVVVQDSGMNFLDAMTVTYNNSGKVSSINQGGTQQWDITYANNLEVIRLTDKNGLNVIDSIQLNSSGMPISAVEIGNFYNRRIVTNYTYSISGYLQKSTYLSTEVYNNQLLTDSGSTTYQYTNGDLTSSSKGDSISYYQDKPYANFDDVRAILSITEYFYRSSPIPGIYYWLKSKHLPKSSVSPIIVVSPAGRQNFDYTYDAAGKIVSIKRMSNNGLGTTFTYVMSFQYNCK